MAATSQIAPVSAQPPSRPHAANPPRGAAKAPAASAGAPPKAKTAFRFGNLGELSAPLAVLGIVMAMILPIPSFLLDILLSANITFSVLVVVASCDISLPVVLGVFPASLRLLTGARLTLNLSPQRLILLAG